MTMPTEFPTPEQYEATIKKLREALSIQGHLPEKPCPRCGYDGLGESVEGCNEWMRKEIKRLAADNKRLRAVIETLKNQRHVDDVDPLTAAADACPVEWVTGEELRQRHVDDPEPASPQEADWYRKLVERLHPPDEEPGPDLKEILFSARQQSEQRQFDERVRASLERQFGHRAVSFLWAITGGPEP